MKDDISKIFTYDFAISYAGEEEGIAKGIFQSIKEKHGDYSIFFAPEVKAKLIGQDGEEFFENLFTYSKQVIVILSENYKRKEWARYEWDIIKKRSQENRCIPIKIGDVKILGLPSNFIYLRFSNNFEEIASLCIQKLISFERKIGIQRETEFQKTLNDLRDSSKGAIDKSFQLVVDNRQRITPLKDINYPTGNYNKSYEIISEKDLSFSVISRLKIKIDLPDNLSKDEVVFNIKHCTAYIFNKKKPDALVIFIYSSKSANFQDFGKFNVARADFAPLGDWGKAEEGFVYNLPLDKFDWKIEFEESYFDKNKKMKTADELARDLILEALKNKHKNESTGNNI